MTQDATPERQAPNGERKSDPAAGWLLAGMVLWLLAGILLSVDQDFGPLGLTVAAVGTAALLVVIIAKGVELGIRAARDR
ncbi:hypothetical protein [Aeromicrobium sp.]|uniref:hypothetical protein n=1 Tax=Aeromicrobium sp. TaxID=1871063 RepID=UPI0028B1875E|nr:hypothetical protein [Aeromicrobium sp.]